MTAQRLKSRQAAGRADPFGLLVIAVLLAVSLTIVVQAQASRAPGETLFQPAVAPLAFLN